MKSGIRRTRCVNIRKEQMMNIPQHLLAMASRMAKGKEHATLEMNELCRQAGVTVTSARRELEQHDLTTTGCCNIKLKLLYHRTTGRIDYERTSIPFTLNND